MDKATGSAPHCPHPHMSSCWHRAEETLDMATEMSSEDILTTCIVTFHREGAHTPQLLQCHLPHRFPYCLHFHVMNGRLDICPPPVSHKHISTSLLELVFSHLPIWSRELDYLSFVVYTAGVWGHTKVTQKVNFPSDQGLHQEWLHQRSCLCLFLACTLDSLPKHTALLHQGLKETWSITSCELNEVIF
jgi:hypothetical protein